MMMVLAWYYTSCQVKTTPLLVWCVNLPSASDILDINHHQLISFELKAFLGVRQLVKNVGGKGYNLEIDDARINTLIFRNYMFDTQLDRRHIRLCLPKYTQIKSSFVIFRFQDSRREILLLDTEKIVPRVCKSGAMNSLCLLNFCFFALVFIPIIDA